MQHCKFCVLSLLHNTIYSYNYLVDGLYGGSNAHEQVSFGEGK